MGTATFTSEQLAALEARAARLARAASSSTGAAQRLAAANLEIARATLVVAKAAH